MRSGTGAVSCTMRGRGRTRRGQTGWETDGRTNQRMVETVKSAYAVGVIEKPTFFASYECVCMIWSLAVCVLLWFMCACFCVFGDGADAGGDVDAVLVLDAYARC